MKQKQDTNRYKNLTVKLRKERQTDP